MRIVAHKDFYFKQFSAELFIIEVHSYYLIQTTHFLCNFSCCFRINYRHHPCSKSASHSIAPYDVIMLNCLQHPGSMCLSINDHSMLCNIINTIIKNRCMLPRVTSPAGIIINSLRPSDAYMRR